MPQEMFLLPLLGAYCSGRRPELLHMIYVFPLNYIIMLLVIFWERTGLD